MEVCVLKVSFLAAKKKLYFFSLAAAFAFGVAGGSSCGTKPIERFLAGSGGVLNSRIASNAFFNNTRVWCSK